MLLCSCNGKRVMSMCVPKQEIGLRFLVVANCFRYISCVYRVCFLHIHISVSKKGFIIIKKLISLKNIEFARIAHMHVQFRAVPPQYNLQLSLKIFLPTSAVPYQTVLGFMVQIIYSLV